MQAQVVPGPGSSGGPTSVIVGQVQTSTGGSINYGALTFSLSQSAVVAGSASIATEQSACYTSAQGNIVGVPDPVATPVLSVNLSAGSLPAGTYYVVSYYVGAGGVSAVSPEASINLSSPGTLRVNAPGVQPNSATGYGVAIATTSGAETIQGVVTGWTQYAQSVALVTGAAPHALNTSFCSLYLSDQLIPTGTYYTVNLVNKNGSQIAGFPQSWCMYGGAGATINISNGAPTGNCSTSGVFYPTPIFANPPNTLVQSIFSGLNIGGSLNVVGIATLHNPILTNPTSTGTDLGVETLQNKTIQNSEISSAQFPIDVRAYGAKCDGVTDDTAAFAAATTAAFPNNGGSAKSLSIPATGNGCVISQWNLTNINNEINIQGQSSISGFQSIVWCRESNANAKVCVDFTGSQYVSVKNVDFYGGTSAANSPRVTVLLAKSNTGNSQIIHFDDVTVEGYGDYQVYNYGGEVWKCYYCTFYQHGAGGVDLVRLTASNSVGITSPFATIGTGNISMSMVDLWATWSAGGSSDGLAIETSGIPVTDITLGGFGNLTSATSFIRDLGAGEIHGLRLKDLRVEPSCTNCGLLSLSNVVSNLRVDAQWAASSAPSVTEINLAAQVNNADIEIRPGDGQLQFPSTNVVTCSGAVVGVVIHDYIKFGGGSQLNSCPGALEFGGVGGLFINGATNGDQGTGTINVSAGYYLNGVQVPPVLLATLTTTAATTNTVTVTGMTSSGHCSLQPTNAGAAGGIASVFVSNKTTNQITVTHTATSGWTFDVMCTPN